MSLHTNTLKIGTVVTIVTIFTSLVGAYYTAQGAISDKINESQNATQAQISADRERIAKLEEAVGTIKDDTTSIKSDIKDILKAVRIK